MIVESAKLTDSISRQWQKSVITWIHGNSGTCTQIDFLTYCHVNLWSDITCESSLHCIIVYNAVSTRYQMDTRMKFNYLFYWSDLKAYIFLTFCNIFYQTYPNFKSEIKHNWNKFEYNSHANITSRDRSAHRSCGHYNNMRSRTI